MASSGFFKKGQSSFEYILVVGMVMLFIVSGVGFIYNYSQRSNNDVALANIGKAGQDILLTADKVYYIGSDSWETIKVNIPSNVKEIYIMNNNELVIEYESFGGISESVFFSDINLTTPNVVGNKKYISDEPHVGVAVIKVTSYGSYVNITEVN